MTEEHTVLTTVYKGWDVYQNHLTTAIAPLSPAQLTLRAAPHLRTIGEIAVHIIGARARWSHDLMGIGGEALTPLASRDRSQQSYSASELVAGLETTWQALNDALAHWTVADLTHVYRGVRGGEEYELTRQWVLWHLIEHDMHHGGELAFSLGMHGLGAPDL